jgi:hypothetical protein
MIPQRPLPLALPRQLGLPRLVLQWCGAGFTADGHGYGLPQRKMATLIYGSSSWVPDVFIV